VNHNSKPMGSFTRIHRLQLGCGSMLRNLFLPVPSFILETTQVRHIVSPYPFLLSLFLARADCGLVLRHELSLSAQ
jgi:hypothetical protein